MRILLLIPLLFFYGCTAPQSDSYVDGLVDTVYVDELSHQLLLTDGKGGYYFDDALRLQSRGEYGLCWMGVRLLADWELEADGERIDREAEYCLVHPEWIERYYRSGLVERVESAHLMQGLLLSFYYKPSRELILKPYLDYSQVGSLEGIPPLEQSSPQMEWMADQYGLIVTYEPHADQLVLLCPRNSDFTPAPSFVLKEYPDGWRQGGMPRARLFVPGEFHLGGRGWHTIAVAYGEEDQTYTISPYAEGGWSRKIDVTRPVLSLAQEIIAFQDGWRSARREWSRRQLERLQFRCQNKGIERAFAWGRLTLAKLIVTLDHRTLMLTGIPHNPYQQCWHACLSIPGLALSQQDVTVGRELLSTLLHPRPGGAGTVEYEYPLTEGSLPTAISLHNAAAAYTGVEGLAVNALRRLEALAGIRDTVLGELLARRVADSYPTLTDHLEHGLVINEGHYLGDAPPHSDRRGATIESQVLFHIVREFIRRSEYAARFPPTALEGISSARFDPEGYPPTASGQRGQFRLPLNWSALIQLYHPRIGGSWYDRFILHSDEPSGSQRSAPPAIIPDSTQTLSPILALGWIEGENQKLNRHLLDNALQVGLLGEVTFRSLAVTEPAYQSAHEYLLVGAASGTVSKGDQLIWSAGRLADMLKSLGQYDSLWVLAEQLSERVLNRGVVGGLPEAENGDPLPFGDNIVRNPVYCTSLAEYVRLMVEHIIGLDWNGASEIALRPHLPEAWGEISVETNAGGKRIIIHRLTSEMWSLFQSGFDPYLTVSLELYPQAGERLFASAKVYQDEKVVFRLEKAEDRWTVRVKR